MQTPAVIEVMSPLVVASDAPAEILRQARQAHNLYGDLVLICDGVDDDVQVQAAVDAAEAQGAGEVRLSAGNFHFSASVNLRTGVVIIGSGPTTIIIPDDDIAIFTGADITRPGVKNLLIHDATAVTATNPAISLDCVSFGEFDYIHIYDYYDGIAMYSTINNANTTRENFFDNINIQGIRHNGLYITKEVHDNHFSNLGIIGVGGSNDGIRFDGTVGGFGGLLICGGNRFANVLILTMGQNGLLIHQWLELWFDNLICDDCGNDGIAITKAGALNYPEAFNFNNVWASANGNNGLEIVGVVAEHARGIKFTNLHAWGNTNFGIILNQLVDDSYFQGITYRNGQDGIVIINCSGIIIASGTICLENEHHGIRLTGGSTGCNINGCNCVGNSRNNANTFDNIRIEGSPYNLVASCICRVGVNLPAWGINISDDCAGNMIHGNDLYNSGNVGDLNDAAVTIITRKRDNRNLAGNNWLADV